MPDLDRYELRNKAVKSAGWQGWRYGMGIAALIVFGFAHLCKAGDWSFLIACFIAGATLGPLGMSVFKWMEIVRWNVERRDV